MFSVPVWSNMMSIYLKNFSIQLPKFIYVVRRRGRLTPHQPLSVCALLPEQASTASWEPQPPFEVAEMD